MKTNDKDTKGIVPALRFPEFREDNGWEETPMHQIGKTLTGLSGKKSSDFGYGKRYITYKQVYSDNVNDFDKCEKVFVNESEKQNSIQQGDILFTTSSETPDEVGISSVLLKPLSETIYLNSFCFILRPYDINQLYPQFAKYLFQSPIYRKKINKLAQGAIRFNLSKNQFIHLSLPVAKESREQQKIAECLSSIDALIKATENKIDELKAHKKGLMQQLFPAEGKTVPALRFPEFQNAGEWETPHLNQISTRITTKVGCSKLPPVSISAGIGFVAQTEKFGRDISGEQYRNYIELKRGEFAYNKGNSKKYPQGCVYRLKEFEKVAAPNAFICFRFENSVIPDFFKGYFDSNYHGKQLQNVITSGARSNGLLNISADDFFNIILPTPKDKEEQQKIADCLSSIDDLITAQTNRLEALKTHKKGLMQQLFPNIDEC